jgi:predicted DNA-binding protein
MTELTIQLSDTSYQRLEKIARRMDKSINTLIDDLINHFSDEEDFDVTQDPVYLMEGFDSDAPRDLASNLDKYLYGENYPVLLK